MSGPLGRSVNQKEAFILENNNALRSRFLGSLMCSDERIFAVLPGQSDKLYLVHAQHRFEVLAASVEFPGEGTTLSLRDCVDQSLEIYLQKARYDDEEGVATLPSSRGEYYIYRLDPTTNKYLLVADSERQQRDFRLYALAVGSNMQPLMIFADFDFARKPQLSGLVAATVDRDLIAKWYTEGLTRKENQPKTNEAAFTSAAGDYGGAGGFIGY